MKNIEPTLPGRDPAASDDGPRDPSAPDGGFVVSAAGIRALKAELEHYRLAVAASRQGLWDWDLDTGIIWTSSRAHDLLGLGKGTFGSSPALNFEIDAWMAAVHPDDHDRVADAIDDHLKNNAPYDLVYRYRRPDGEFRWIHTIGMAVRGDDGTPKRMLGAINDITERKLAERALRDSQAESLSARTYLTGALESMVDGFGIFDADERLVMCNEQFGALAGKAAHLYQPGEVFEDIVRRGAELGQWQLDEGGVEGFVARRLAGFRAGRRYELQRADGTWMEAYDHKTKDGLTICYRIDITERKAAERALRESERRLREAQIISNIGDVEYIAESNTSRWSDVIYSILGRDKETFESSYDSFMACVHQDDRLMVARDIAEGTESGKPFSYEHRIVRPAGEVRFVLHRMVPRYSESGEFLGRAGTVQDVTERKAIEEQLQQAQKMEVVGQLTGGVAHDFNNLLAVIMGNLEMIRERIGAGKDVNDMIESGVRAAERGADLTQRLLAFSRRQLLMPVVIDLNSLVSGMIEILRRTLGEKVTITTREPAALWLCEADRSQLENALLNLAINARDAMPDGGDLTIETVNVLLDEAESGVPDIAPGPYVVLRVSDTGSGIDEETLAHVFEPFFTTKGFGKGSGLGLSMVYGFARQSGGNVTIESEPGGGTVVNLYLPRAAEREARGEEDSPQREIVLGNGEHILVVEDDGYVREQAVNLLNALGYQASHAASGQAALNVLAASPPFDLLLSDVVLPDLNGPALAEKIKRSNPDIAVVYMTGYAEGAIEHHAGEGKSTPLINKPFTKADLARAVHEALLHA